MSASIHTSTSRSRSVASLVALAVMSLAAAPAFAQPAEALAYHYDAPAAVSATPAPIAATLAASDDVLATLWSNPSHAASLTRDAERSGPDFARFALAMAAVSGAYASHEVLGTAPSKHGGTYVYARVYFDRAPIDVRLTWADATLVTITRGVKPPAEASLAGAR